MKSLFPNPAESQHSIAGNYGYSQLGEVTSLRVPAFPLSHTVYLCFLSYNAGLAISPGEKQPPY